jgi:hypothetical protein
MLFIKRDSAMLMMALDVVFFTDTQGIPKRIDADAQQIIKLES